MVMATLLWNAAKGINGGDFGSSQSPLVDDDLFENVYDEDEDVFVYSGENYEAVVNQNGLVQTEEDEFFLSNSEYKELVEIAATKLGAYEEITGLETEDGETNQHVYIGQEENYSGKIDKYTETEFRFDQVENLLKGDQLDNMLEDDQEPRVEYDTSAQRATV